MKELKPCPFCGGEAKLTKGITYLDNYVTCCECFSRTKTYNTKESAIKSWNKRNAWIPCKERLPKEDGKYLCDIGNDDCAVGRYTKNFGWMFPFYVEKVIAWQPLPPKYEE